MVQQKNMPEKMVKLALKERTLLFKSYMSFLSNGGIFISTDDIFELEEEVLLVLEVMEHNKTMPLRCKVIWINQMMNQFAKGIGLAFPNDAIGKEAKEVIERNLAGVLDNPHQTFTL